MLVLTIIIVVMCINKCSSQNIKNHEHVDNKICKCIAYDTEEENFLEEKIRVVQKTNISIQVLHENLIHDLVHVEKIILSSNGITTVKSMAFQNLPSLKSLDLSNNSITTMEFGIFLVTPKITRISLRNNQLWHFEPEWFGEVLNLEWLDLGHNSIKTILRKAFSSFPTLQHLNLERNKIMQIDEHAFENSKKLEILDLSYNRLSHLDETLFSHFEDLKVLNLYSNHLSFLSDGVLRSLNSLRQFVVLFNPWQCECYNKILEWAGDNRIGIRNRYLKCRKTKQLENIPVCVYGSKTTKCIENKLEELCDILYLQIPDFECDFLTYKDLFLQTF